MKQEMTITLTDEFKGRLENINRYTNQMNEPMKIYNFHTSSLFDNKNLEVLDEKNRKLEYSFIPFNNGKHLYYAVTMTDPVRTGDPFVIKLSHPLDKAYFDATTEKKEGLYFWSINHCPMIECEFLCTINLPDEFQLLHIIGTPPATQSESKLFWRIKMTREQVFSPHIVYRKK